MNNWEKHRDEISMLVAAGFSFGVKNGEVIACGSVSCKDCTFHNAGCSRARLVWLQKEAEGESNE